MDTNKLLQDSTATAQAAAQSIGENFKQGVGVVPAPTVPTTISSDTLKNGTAPYQLPPLVNTTAPATALGTTAGIASGGAEADAKAAETAAASTTPVASANPDRNAVLAGIMDNLKLESTKGDFTTATQNDAGLADKTNALNDINKNITLTTQSYDNQIKELKKNNEGLVGPGFTDKVNELTAKKNEDLANLAIIKSTALGDVDTANAIIKQKVDAKFSPIEDNIKNLENYAQLMQNDLSDSEKLTVQSKIDDQKTAKANVSSAYAEASKTAAANGAPASVQSAIDAAAKQATQDILDGKTPSTGAIYGALGSYGQNAQDVALKNAQIRSLNATAAAKTTSGAAGANGGVSPALQDAITNGTIDPNRINSRTLGIYNAIANAGVDAVGSHAGAAGETKAVTDLTAYKSVAQRTLNTIDANLPLVMGLADKVNQTGIPGLDSYIAGVKAYTGNNTDVIKYINSLKTLRSEYAQMLAKGNAATEGDKLDATQAIPSGLSSAGYQALGQQLKLEATNIIGASNDAISSAESKTTPATSSNLDALRTKYNY